MTIITIGIDLTKNIFALHGVNESGHAELVKPKASRHQLLPLIAKLPPCLIGMEAVTAGLDQNCGVGRSQLARSCFRLG